MDEEDIIWDIKNTLRRLNPDERRSYLEKIMYEDTPKLSRRARKRFYALLGDTIVEIGYPNLAIDAYKRAGIKKGDRRWSYAMEKIINEKKGWVDYRVIEAAKRARIKKGDSTWIWIGNVANEKREYYIAIEAYKYGKFGKTQEELKKLADLYEKVGMGRKAERLRRKAERLRS